MKKILALALVLVLGFSLVACKDDGNEYKGTFEENKAALEGHYELNGCTLNVLNSFKRLKSDEFDIVLLSEDGTAEYHLRHESPEVLTENGISADITAEDYALFLTHYYGLQELASQQGATEVRKPDFDEESGMAHFGYVYGDDNGSDFTFIAVRAVEGDGLWVFTGICKEEDIDTYRDLFISWSKNAVLTSTK